LRKTVSGILLFLLLVSTLTVAFNIQPAKAEGGTIYIRADGSIDPPDAPIITVDNVIYTLTANITSNASGIVVERDNIVVDGAGYTLQGTGGSTSYGIDISGRRNITIKNINIENFGYGIYLLRSSLNTILNNNAGGPISLKDSPHNTLKNNTMWRNFYISGSDLSHYLQDIDTSNKINGNFPIYYLVNERDKVIDKYSKAGFVAAINSENITVKGLDEWSTMLRGNSHGVLFVNTNNSKIESIKAYYNQYQICLLNSFNNVVSRNYWDRSGCSGIYLLNSSENIFTNNEAVEAISSSFSLYNSSNNIISNNILKKLFWSDYEIYLERSNNNLITNNDIILTEPHGGYTQGAIFLHYSNNNTILSNYLRSIGLRGINNWIALIFSSNNKILCNNIRFNEQSGISIGWNSSYNIVFNNTILQNIGGSGIALGSYAFNNTVSNNNIDSNGGSGISLGYAFYNLISNNSISWNSYGINVHGYSSGNKIYHNNFINNLKQSYLFYAGENFFDDGYPSGGNYWSDYINKDEFSGPHQDQPGSDGIWDNPYVINSNNKDRYPLVNPWTPTPNQPPYDPAAVSQYRSDGVTVIPEGGTTPESTVVFKATVSDPNGDSVRLEIELRRIGEPFTG
jgi:parallel beta-helix repeat protein